MRQIVQTMIQDFDFQGAALCSTGVTATAQTAAYTPMETDPV